MYRRVIPALAVMLLMPAGSHAQIAGSALALSGNDEYACTALFIGQPSALTISAWVKIPTGGVGGMIVGNHHNGVNWESVELGKNFFIINSSNGIGTRQQLGISDLDDDQWHHVAAVWDGAEMRVYVDGQLHAGPAVAPSGPWLTAEPLTIGARPSTVDPPVNSEFQGLLDELRIWTVARSQAQIQSTMHAVLGPEYYASADSGLFAYWRFDQLEDLGFKNAGANDVRDLSVSGGHAEVVGGMLVPISVSVPDALQPSALRLAVFPNPSQGEATIRFTLPRAASARVAIYDLNGRHVRTLANGPYAAGVQVLSYDGRDAYGRHLPAGHYYVQLTTGDRSRRAAIVVRP